MLLIPSPTMEPTVLPPVIVNGTNYHPHNLSFHAYCKTVCCAPQLQQQHAKLVSSLQDLLMTFCSEQTQ